MDYFSVLRSLCNLLEHANKADSEFRDSWQHPNDAGDPYYGNLRQAIVHIAGDQFVNNWAITGCWDWTLANRGHRTEFGGKGN